jgi:hypothetical protein
MWIDFCRKYGLIGIVVGIVCCFIVVGDLEKLFSPGRSVLRIASAPGLLAAGVLLYFLPDLIGRLRSPRAKSDETDDPDIRSDGNEEPPALPDGSFYSRQPPPSAPHR